MGKEEGGRESRGDRKEERERELRGDRKEEREAERRKESIGLVCFVQIQ